MPALLVMVALVVSAGSGAAQTLPGAAELASRVQAHYATVQAFTADFTLRQRSGVMPREALDRGKVAIKKPGRMKWTFATGNQNHVVADGSQIYYYFPKDKYVQIAPLPKGDAADTALLFLMGRGNIVRDFTATLPAGQPAAEWQLRLTPKTSNPDFATLTLIVDRSTLALRGFDVVDQQGGTQEYRFSNLRENQSLPDRDFTFDIPKGVDIRR